MKKILAIVAACLVLISCQKEINTRPSNVKVPVKFNVSGFTQSHAPFEKLTATTSTPKSYEMFYVVYDKHGQEVNRVYQKKSTTTFDAIIDSLTVGTYTVVFTAGEASINLNQRYVYSDDKNSYIKSALNGAFVQYVRGLDSPYRTKDLFYKKITVDVSEGGVEENVVLERSIGKISLLIEDIEKNEHTIFVELKNEAEGLYLNSGLPWGRIAGSELSIGTYNIVNTAEPIEMRVVAYNPIIGEVITEKTVHVKVNKNQTTIVRGNLFDNIPPGEPNGFNVTLSEEWGTDEIEIEL